MNKNKSILLLFVAIVVALLSIVGMVDSVGKSFSFNDGIDNGAAVSPFDEASIGRIHMAVKYPRDVVAIINTDEFTAEGIAVTVLEENLLDNRIGFGVKVHREKFTIKGQR